MNLKKNERKMTYSLKRYVAAWMDRFRKDLGFFLRVNHVHEAIMHIGYGIIRVYLLLQNIGIGNHQNCIDMCVRQD